MARQCISVGVVEDDSAYRKQLVSLLSTSGGFNCVGAFARGKAAVEGILRDKPDVVLMDICLPDISGIECTRRLMARQQKVKVVMLTMIENSEQIFAALEAGAQGYLFKDTRAEALLASLKDVAEDRPAISPSVARHLIRYFNVLGRTRPHLEKLTAREEQVLRLLASGKSDKQIATQLQLTERTVAAHCYNIYRKLHVNSRTEAIAIYNGQRSASS